MVIAVDFGRVAAEPNPLVRNWSSILQVLGASLLIALCAQIKVTLPFTPVPITMQTLAILLVGATLGSRKGALAVLAYFSEILMGLPVLSNAAIDPLVFLGPKAGYVLGFLVQAYCMGWMVERMKVFSVSRVFLAGLVACTLEMSLGVLGLAPYVGWNNVLWMGVYPFLVGEIVKVCVMCYILKRSSFASIEQHG
ncbi:putative biotin transporter BioY [Candidatus Protochlamydia naegleriophila]|uniref:Biotin transporter n=1 Tax=Candidatus Protochlamydia naegleriophila TaxID=389348 RepID=A0A0U5JG15_9BACT|nr:biotin transporter BioY [Candidatus Protochlamydia naegleriophila]CUI17780.1 putative biotin transporter BioY [Candidatus Protochlamydia naegleriophila]